MLESLLNLSCNSMSNPEEARFNEILENKFYCSRKFVEEIESIALENKDMKYNVLKKIAGDIIVASF